MTGGSMAMSSMDRIRFGELVDGFGREFRRAAGLA
jgi:hypothetical protein